MEDSKTPESLPVRSKWLGFAELRPTSRGTYRLSLRWGRIFALFIVLGVGAWMGKSVAFYYFFKTVRDFEEVSFNDMILFPLNRSAVRVAQGDYQIRMGEKALEREDYRRALSMLQNGVARSPANLEGRMLLVRLYSGWKPDLALDLLEGGVEYGRENEEFIGIYSLLLSQQRRDDELMELTGNLLADPDLPEEVHQIAAVHRMKTAITHGQFDLAEKTYETTPLEGSAQGLFLVVDLLEKAAEEERAAAVLETIINRFRDDQVGPYYRRLIRL